MKIFALIFLVIGVSMVSAAPQDIHSAILGVFNSAVPVVAVQPVPTFAIRPPPGGVSAFAAAQQTNGPSGTNFNAQTGISKGRN